MTRKLVLKENQTNYTLAIAENDLTDQPIILEQDGREIAAIIPIEMYRAFEAWEKQQVKSLSYHAEFEAEKAVFEKLEPELMADYAGKYVAIRGGKLVDSDEDKMNLITRVYNTLGYGPMYVHKVGEPTRIAKIISPRIIKQ